MLSVREMAYSFYHLLMVVKIVFGVIVVEEIVPVVIVEIFGIVVVIHVVRIFLRFGGRCRLGGGYAACARRCRSRRGCRRRSVRQRPGAADRCAAARSRRRCQGAGPVYGVVLSLCCRCPGRGRFGGCWFRGCGGCCGCGCRPCSRCRRSRRWNSRDLRRCRGCNRRCRCSRSLRRCTGGKRAAKQQTGEQQTKFFHPTASFAYTIAQR